MAAIDWNAEKIAMLVVGIVFVVFSGICMIWWYTRRHHPIISSRNSQLTLVVSSMGYSIVTCIASVAAVLYPTFEMRCNIYLWILVFLLGFWAIPFLLRSLYLVFMTYFNQHVIFVRNPERQRRLLTMKSWFSLKGYVFAIMLWNIIQFIPHIIVFTVDPPKNEVTISHYECIQTHLYICFGFMVLTFFLLNSLILKVYNSPDPFHIRLELLFGAIFQGPVLLIYAILIFDSNLFIENVMYWVFMAACYGSTGNIFLIPILLTYDKIQNLLIRSPIGGFYAAELDNLHTKLKSDNVFQAVLKNETLLNSFQRFCAKKWCLENILLYLEVIKYQEMPSGSDQVVAAKRIAKDFIYKNAPMQVNILNQTRISVEDRIRQNIINSTLFNDSLKEVVQLMETSTFREWQTTPEFKAAIDSVIASIDQKRSNAAGSGSGSGIGGSGVGTPVSIDELRTTSMSSNA